MATVEAVRQRGRTKYHKKLAPLLFARMTTLQHAVQNLPRRAWTERMRVGGSFSDIRHRGRWCPSLLGLSMRRRQRL